MGGGVAECKTLLGRIIWGGSETQLRWSSIHYHSVGCLRNKHRSTSNSLMSHLLWVLVDKPEVQLDIVPEDT